MTLIAGFWEDYICPTHYEVIRRTITLRQPSDLLSAYEYYFMGQVLTTEIPQCSICHQKMEGGQILSSLPFYIEPYIELQQWLITKLELLKTMIKAEDRALLQGKQVIQESAKQLQAEVELLQRFYQALAQQLDIRIT